MKKFELLGKRLTKEEQKKILGGSGDECESPPDCVAHLGTCCITSDCCPDLGLVCTTYTTVPNKCLRQ